MHKMQVVLDHKLEVLKYLLHCIADGGFVLVISTVVAFAWLPRYANIMLSGNIIVNILIVKIS